MPLRSFTSLFLAAAAALGSLARPAVAVSAAPGSGARVLPIAAEAFAGSSVNVLANLQNTLFTHGETQYAAFYASDGTVVLARRHLASDEWITHRTALKGDVANAHNTIALAVDGAGYLHLSWNHHMVPLNYTRSLRPGSFELEPSQSMLGRQEDQVTYPAFLTLPDGDLLFNYRDGVSGRGNLILNRYHTATRTWNRVQNDLIDGEGQRSAYIATTVDSGGTLHLAWNWRETPDVATNHDLCYARSPDGGATWTTSTGALLTLPLTAATAEYAVRIPERSTLINAFSLTTDYAGHPYLANYWCPPGSDVPQYHFVRHDGRAWHVHQITRRTEPFELSGTATRSPPISRNTLFVRPTTTPGLAAYMIFRDDEKGGAVMLARSDDVLAARPTWTFAPLTADAVGRWEPSADPVQWTRRGQIHLLVQNVQQRDGNDRNPLPVPPSPIVSS